MPFSDILGGLAVFVLAASASSTGMAASATVPQGCDSPAESKTGRTFYIDPARGDMANDGSAERPWRTFAEVVGQASHLVSSRAYLDYIKGPRELQPVNPQGPIKSGDTLVLMSGDHGAVDLRKYENSDFIHVVAAPGQTPVIRSMRVLSSSHWHFKGLKFQGARPENLPMNGYNTALVDVSDTDPYGPGDNIVFESNSFSTQDDVAGWTDADWVRLPYEYGLRLKSRCSTASGNHFSHGRDAVALAGADSLAADNLVESMGNDGFDIVASNVTVRHNIVRDGHHTPGEPLHADGVQGWTIKGATNRNVVIESNEIVDTSQSDDNYMQGISIFDGAWDGLVISNNVVLTNIWHGIALYGVDNARIVNNTVLPARAGKYMTWITVHPSKTKAESTNVIVRNNIAGRIVANGINVAVDHNIALKDISAAPMRGAGERPSGVAFSANMENVPVDTLFVSFDMSRPVYDLRLAPKSPARQFGAEDLAPPADIIGRARKAPFDVGAYAR